MTKKTVLVTGASRGIGLACAQELARAGHKVVLAARSLDKLEKAAAAINATGGEAFVATIDLASLESIQSSIKEMIAQHGPIHILVNNAGVTKDGLSMRMKPEDWNSVIQTNLTGAFLCDLKADLKAWAESHDIKITVPWLTANPKARVLLDAWLHEPMPFDDTDKAPT